MKIAVTYDNGEVFQHFGHAQFFKIYNVENGVVISSDVVSTDGSGHSAIAQFLIENSVDTLICGGIGGCAQRALAEGNIKLYGGVVGSADDAVAALLSDSLVYDPDAKCSHHGHSHSDGEHHHACGGHCNH